VLDRRGHPVPTVGFLLVGGALSDRIERRRLLVWASLMQALAIGTIGILDIGGLLHISAEERRTERQVRAAGVGTAAGT
jgi:MFS family permease